MSGINTIDCIIIGHNEGDFSAFAAKQKEIAQHNGSYGVIKCNSLLYGGQRITYGEFLEQTLRGTGRVTAEKSLSPWSMPNFTVLYLTTYLKKRNYQVEYINFYNTGKEKLVQLLQQFPLSVVITTTFYFDSTPIGEIVNLVREYCPMARIIIGGPYAYNICNSHEESAQDYIFQEAGVDIIINDLHGEESLAMVLQKLKEDDYFSLDTVPNVIFSLDGERYLRAPQKPEIPDIDNNCIDWSFFDGDVLSPAVTTRTSLSCAFKCNFCKYHTMAGPHRPRDLQFVEKELRQFHQVGVRNIYFVDDTFNIPLPRFKKLLRLLIANRFNFRWMSLIRCSALDEEAADLMKESGCCAAFLGIESGDAAVLKNMNKKAVPGQYYKGIRMLEERGIATGASLVVGYPGECPDSIRRTVELIETAAPTFYRAELFYLDPFAPIGNKEKQKEFGIDGLFYGWKHNTMDWVEALDRIYDMYRNIKNSIIFPLYGFDLESNFVLLHNGFSFEQQKSFLKICQEMLIAGLDDRPFDVTPYDKRLTEVFSTFSS